MFFVYIIKNKQGKLYIGQSENPERRLLFHNSDKNRYTKNKGPWIFIYKRPFSKRSDAVRFERHLKKQKGGNGLEKILEKNGLAPV